MCRLAIICLLCLGLLGGGYVLASETGAPWVSCFEHLPYGEGAWKGPKTVRTPLVTSADGKLRAYAQIEAKSEGPKNPKGCLNTVRLFVSTQRSAGFRQVFLQKPSLYDGTANSLGPISWSPNGRWLLVEFLVGSYESDAGGFSILLYDNSNGKIVEPYFDPMLKTVLKQNCSSWVGRPFHFDSLSRVHLRLSDLIEIGDDKPLTHCFHGEEEWVFDPGKGTLQNISMIR